VIVLGTHGRTGVERLLMGSVAEKVMREAPCSVLVVKLPKGSATPERPHAAAAAV
jgi:nucleotide-binding universal stress UspA family protein